MTCEDRSLGGGSGDSADRGLQSRREALRRQGAPRARAPISTPVSSHCSHKPGPSGQKCISHKTSPAHRWGTGILGMNSGHQCESWVWPGGTARVDLNSSESGGEGLACGQPLFLLPPGCGSHHVPSAAQQPWQDVHLLPRPRGGRAGRGHPSAGPGADSSGCLCSGWVSGKRRQT